MKELNELRKKENVRIEEVAAKKSKKEQRLDDNTLFGEFKAEQELYKEKTAGNKFTKADYNSGKVVRKNREADTMAMLKGFRSTLFDAKEIEGKQGGNFGSAKSAFSDRRRQIFRSAGTRSAEPSIFVGKISKNREFGGIGKNFTDSPTRFNNRHLHPSLFE